MADKVVKLKFSSAVKPLPIVIGSDPVEWHAKETLGVRLPLRRVRRSALSRLSFVAEIFLAGAVAGTILTKLLWN